MPIVKNDAGLEKVFVDNLEENLIDLVKIYKKSKTK